MKLPAWRTDKPAPGRVVEVWFLTTVILAAWTGNEWRTADGDSGGLRTLLDGGVTVTWLEVSA